MLEVNDFLIEFAANNPYSEPLVVTISMFDSDLVKAMLAKVGIR